MKPVHLAWTPRRGHGRVNYLLAACTHRIGRAHLYPPKEILRAHLRELGKTDTRALAQLTIIRALPLVRDANHEADAEHYWDIEEELAAIECPVVILDVEDYCFSYSSWVQAIMLWSRLFDYYILMEDDYYPTQSRFVEILVEVHQRKLPMGGFLCSFATDHAASSNGIVDSRTFVGCLDRLPDPIRASSAGQNGFAAVFCAGRLADYTDRYRCLHHSTQIVELVHTHGPGDHEGQPIYRCTEDLIRPIEYLLTGEVPFSKSVSNQRVVCPTT